MLFFQSANLHYRIIETVSFFYSNRDVVAGLSQTLLNDHEILTLARHYGKKQYPILTSLMELIHGVLKRENYTSFSLLEAAFEAEDEGQGGFIRRDQIRFICNRVSLPLSDQLIDGAVMK